MALGLLTIKEFESSLLKISATAVIRIATAFIFVGDGTPYSQENR